MGTVDSISFPREEDLMSTEAYACLARIKPVLGPRDQRSGSSDR